MYKAYFLFHYSFELNFFFVNEFYFVPVFLNLQWNIKVYCIKREKKIVKTYFIDTMGKLKHQNCKYLTIFWFLSGSKEILGNISYILSFVQNNIWKRQRNILTWEPCKLQIDKLTKDESIKIL